MLSIFKKEDGFNYLSPLKKVANVILGDDSLEFVREIDTTLSSNAPYIIGINDKKYYIEMLDEEKDEEKLNKRYLNMAREKDIAIINREGKEILEFQWINYVGDDLEHYFIDYSQLKKKLVSISTNELKEKITHLTKDKGITFSFDFLKLIKEKFKNDNPHFYIDHRSLSYSKQVWSSEDIAFFQETARELKKIGYIFFVSNCGSIDGLFGLVKTNEFKHLKDLSTINSITVEELLDNHIVEQFFTRSEKFEIFYKEHAHEINKGKTETIYKIDATQEACNSLSQIAGRGFGIDNENYPMYDDKPMEHLLSLDLNDFPSLKSKYVDTRVISVYISSFNDNEAYEIDTEETAILKISQEDIDNKDFNIEVSIPQQALNIKVKEIKIPDGFLKLDCLEFEEDSWQEKLNNFIYNFNYIAGDPGWLQNEESLENFVGQFDDMLFATEEVNSDINLGGGIMYMFEDSVFFQC